MDRDYDVITFISNFILRKSRVANFADIMKIITIFIKTFFKNSKKSKKLDIMYQNAIYICIFWYSKFCWFQMKKRWCQQNSMGVSRDSYIFWISFR